MTLAASTSTDKSLKDFDELMRTPIDFSRYILNGLKIKNLTQEILLGPAFRLLKGTRSNYAQLEYDFEECYKALLEKLDWENPEGGDYPFDLSKPLPLITRRKRQRVPFEYFINNDLKYLQGGVSTMTYTTSTTKTKGRSVMRKHGYGYMEEIVVRRADNVLYRFKEGDFPQLRINDIEDMLLIVTLPRYRHGVLAKENDWSTLEKKRAHFIIKDINKLLKERRMMRSLEKFVGGRIYGTDLRLLQRTI
ncbi:hypothetical protein Tco_1336992 [Tanacetum coccineum]